MSGNRDWMRGWSARRRKADLATIGVYGGFVP